jgi:hypothetical protein
MGLEIRRAVNIKIAVLYDVTPRNMVTLYQTTWCHILEDLSFNNFFHLQRHQKQQHSVTHLQYQAIKLYIY